MPKKPRRKLTPKRYEVLAHIVANPEGRLHRLRGGFWVTDETTCEYRDGDWCIDLSMVKIMEKDGFLKRTYQKPQENLDPREITEEGLKALRETPVDRKEGARMMVDRPLWT